MTLVLLLWKQKLGSCIGCIYDAIKQLLIDVPGGKDIINNIALKTKQPPEIILNKNINTHKFGAWNQTVYDFEQNKIGGATSLIKRESNGIGHAHDQFDVLEDFTSTKTSASFGNILMTGTGSYEVNVGKNTIISAATNNFLFGANTNVETNWISPIDTLLSEPILNENCINYPVIRNITKNYYNRYDSYTFGEYMLTFNRKYKFWYI